jgi:hypothetical protein
MSLNSATIKKFLLTAGLLIVLGQGLWQLFELDNYFFPENNEELILRQTRKECSRVEGDLEDLQARVDYLTWFQTHNGPDQKISADRLRAFPFSEAIRPLGPRFFWQTNIRLAHKNRLKVERKLLYLQSLFKNIDLNPPAPPAEAGPALPAPTAAVSSSRQQMQQFQDQCRQYDAKLIKLSQELAQLEHDGYTK